MIVVATIVGMLAVEVAVSRLSSGSSTLILQLTVTIGAVAIGVVAACGIKSRRKPNWDEVAERLDLAVRDHNAIATAIDLINTNAATPPITQLAIDDGITAARTFGSSMLFVPQPSLPFRRNLTWVGVACGALALAWLMPDMSSRVAPGLALKPPIATFAIIPADQDGRPRLHVASEEREQISNCPAKSFEKSSAIGTNGSRQTTTKVNDVSSMAVSSSLTRSIGIAGKAAKSSSAPPGSPSGDAVDSEMTPSDAAEGESDSSLSPTSAEQSQNARNGSDGKTPSNEPKSSPNDGQHDSGSKRTGQPGLSRGSGSESNDATGGNGQGGGQNSPKKSRGVAPLLLGTRQPDLIPARVLEGPDERTKVDSPQRSNPELPADARTVPSRQGAEPIVDIYRIPAADQRTVQEYLETYHEQADSRAQPLGRSE